MVRFLLIVAVLVGAWAMQVNLSGRLKVIDADTIDLDGVRIRLHGIDAPELGQPCMSQGRSLDCGQWARDHVAARFDGRRARCKEVEIDRFGRVVASCTVGGDDMGAIIVEAGWALAYRQYSMDYDLQEKSAAVAGRGLWAFEMESPSTYRSAQFPIQDAPDQKCLIKGNISGNGRIYHVPGAYGYERTRINESEGEQWFCSTEEAEAAGWRPGR